jgi:hypothetical protein
VNATFQVYCTGNTSASLYLIKYGKLFRFDQTFHHLKSLHWNFLPTAWSHFRLTKFWRSSSRLRRPWTIFTTRKDSSTETWCDETFPASRNYVFNTIRLNRCVYLTFHRQQKRPPIRLPGFLFNCQSWLPFAFSHQNLAPFPKFSNGKMAKLKRLSGTVYIKAKCIC